MKVESSYLQRASTRYVDNARRLFLLQINDEAVFEHLALLDDISVVPPTRQCQQHTVVLLVLQTTNQHQSYKSAVNQNPSSNSNSNHP
jgi:hypothetical protein